LEEAFERKQKLENCNGLLNQNKIKNEKRKASAFLLVFKEGTRKKEVNRITSSCFPLFLFLWQRTPFSLHKGPHKRNSKSFD